MRRRRLAAEPARATQSHNHWRECNWRSKIAGAVSGKLLLLDADRRRAFGNAEPMEFVGEEFDARVALHDFPELLQTLSRQLENAKPIVIGPHSSLLSPVFAGGGGPDRRRLGPHQTVLSSWLPTAYAESVWGSPFDADSHTGSDRTYQRSEAEHVENRFGGN